MSKLDTDTIRQQFPALNQIISGNTPIFFDGPGGSQVTTQVLNASREYLAHYNSNLGSPFFASVKTTEVVSQARKAVMALLNSPSEDNIVFGPTATMLMFNFSRAIARDWQVGDEVIVTALDHYSNVSSWQQVAADKGVTVHQIGIDEQTFELDYEELAQKVNANTKLIAFTYASNITGSVVDAARVIKLAQSVGALSFVDAVHYAPHFSIDVQALECDFMVLSGYKFTGPHVAAIYGKAEHLNSFQPYKVAPAPKTAPACWEQGTQNFEGLAGLTAAIHYLASLSGDASEVSVGFDDLRARLVKAFARIVKHERELSEYFLAKAKKSNTLRLYGKTTPEQRTPTFAFRLNKTNPRTFADFCAERVCGVGAGHFYAQGMCEQFDLLDTGGVIRAGCLHYNTLAEIDKLFELIAEFLSC